MPRLAYPLPIAHYAITDVTGRGQFELVFDDPPHSRLLLSGAFTLGTGDKRDAFDPPWAEWVRTVLLSLANVRIDATRYDRQSYLRITFADGRDVFVPDGPFENWHYANDEGLVIHGGVGQVTILDTRR